MSTNEGDKIPRKLSDVSATGEDQLNASSRAAIMKTNSLEKSVSENGPSGSITIVPPFSLRKIYKNLTILALAFILLFTAYNGMVTLQSSLNVEKNVGVNSLIVTYTFLIVNSFLNRRRNDNLLFS